MRGNCLHAPVAIWIALAIAVPSTVRAGRIDDRLQDLLSRTPPDSTVSGLVMLAEQPDVHALQREIAVLGLTSRWRQHEFIIERAQEIAARTQRDLLILLEGWKGEGIVQSVRAYWVTNMIEVEGRPEAFGRLAGRADVGTIYENRPVELRAGPPAGASIRSTTMDLPNNLICVDVEPAWEMGIRGAGRIVAAFDTGADGTHPALAPRWRGARPGVPWYAAWHDPYHNTTFPWDASSHGTHVTGIMVATKPDGTPIGIAPEATWIAAGALISYNVARIIECYQWAVDPDGDPGTIDDVPDVINNSWGTSDDCDATFWDAIDLVEAAGIVNVIAVDNSGPGYATVNSPESRAETPTVNFSVGSVDPSTPDYPVATSSGRGPSPCDMVSIKPEVTAPGVRIYSTYPNGSYGEMSGTSMAAPHVSAAVALLRQLNPDLTVDEVKTALMATARDYGTIGEDNDYGWGIIDIGAAVAYVKESLPLDPPRNLITAVDGDTVDLSWIPPERVNPFDPLIEYRIYRAGRDDPFPPDPVGRVPGNVVSFRDRGVPAGIYKYVATAAYPTGESGPSNEEIAVVGVPSSTEYGGLAGPSLLSAAPNPFKPATVITFRAPASGSFRVTVYDAAGVLVKRLAGGSSAPIHGEESVVWDGRDAGGRTLPSGPYFVRLEGDGSRIVRRIVLLK